MQYTLKFAPIAKLYVVLDLRDHCRPVAAFDTEMEARDWMTWNYRYDDDK